MKQTRTEFIEEMRQYVTRHIERCELFLSMDSATLNHQPAEKKWTALECFAHLNRYGDHYIPAMENKLLHSKPAPKAELVRSGWLGGPSARKMLPNKQTSKMLRMKTFKSMNPARQPQSVNTIQQFIEQNRRLLEILKLAESADLNKIKVPLTIRGMYFRLGDTLRFLIYHNERHVQQAEKAIQSGSRAS